MANSFQIIVSAVIFFLVIPLLFGKLFLEKKLFYWGINIGNYKKGIVLMVGSIIIVLGILFLLGGYTSFYKNYPISASVADNFWLFIFYEVLLGGILVFSYEFFFRGFIMRIVAEKIGAWSIVAQAVLFFGLALWTGTSMWTLAPYVIFAPFGGYIAYKSGSIYYSALAQFIILIIFDASIVRMIR